MTTKISLKKMQSIRDNLQEEDCDEREKCTRLLGSFESRQVVQMKFKPNLNMIFDLTSAYKKLHSRKQLFDIYSEYPQYLAMKLDKFLRFLVNTDLNDKKILRHN